MKTFIKQKKSKKVMAVIMAVLLTVGIMPMDWALTKAAAANTTYTFDAATEAAITGAEKKGAIAEGKYGTDGYFTLTGTVTRGNSSTYSAELAKAAYDDVTGELTKAAGELTFTLAGAADVVISATSTGGSNTSDLSLFDASGNKVIADGATSGNNAVYGTSPATEIKYTNLAAGTYTIATPSDSEYNRGVRILSVVVNEVAAEEAVTTDYTFDAEAETVITSAEKKAAIAEGKYGTDSYFTLSGTVTRGNSSTYSAELAKAAYDDVTGELTKAAGELAFTVTGTADVVISATSTGGSNTSDLSLFDESGNKVTADGATSGNNAVYGTSPATEIKYTGLAAGTYTIATPSDSEYNRGVRILKVVVSETTGGERPARKTWSDVAAPEIGEITVNGGTVTVPFTMVIGYDGADSVAVTMSSNGEAVATQTYAKESTSGSVTFTPSASGDYTFSISAARADETDKTGTDKTLTGFALPLATPSFKSATSEGAGKISLVWDEVTEASSYEVSYSSNGTDYSTPVSVTGTSYVFSGLTVGQEYTFKLTAVRMLPAATSDSTVITAKATSDAQQVWAFSAFGQGVSSDSKNAGYEGNANDGKVTVWGMNGKGKIVPASTDGLSFYYTTVPSNMNFTLSATVTVDEWTLSNGQEGFGLMAADRVGKNGDSSVFWNNSYMASVTKVEYYTNADGTVALDTIKQGSTTAPDGALKATMKLGIGAQEKTGVTKDNLSKLEANDTATVNNEFSSKMTTLEYSGVTGNLVGNATAEVSGTVENPLTTFKMSIQKNNTGYFVSYTNEAGETVTQKYYDTEALSKLDEENIYVGFFASRNAKITVTDINLTTISPEDDEQKEEQPVTTVAPSYKIPSASVANAEDYKLSYVANADGHVVIKAADGTVIAEQDVVAGEKYVYSTKLSLGENEFTVTMVPVDGYKPSEYEVLESYEPVTFTYKVTYNKFDGDVIYVGPDATSSGKGTKEDPIDIYSAVKFASPGQTIVILSGTYNLESTVTVQPGIDGTAENPIIMMADPDGESRPVFDFGRNCEGMVLAGDYWYVQGFDVTNSANGKDGMRLSGSHCTIDDVHTYHNGNTGLQISRFTSTDTREEWPSYNLVLNCTSYGNADEGYEDADGFAAKLTIGDGNVFDGCIAYNNADDGWDLFAKVESGAIGSVTIQNCVAYANGYLEDGTNAGNGNGFKMGGSSMTGYHKLINSVAFDNKAKGIDSNSCPDIQVTNCTSYNNGGANVALYTNDAANTDFMATGVISYRTQFTDVAETFKLKGTQDTTKVYQATNYFWNCTEAGTNNSNGTVTNDWFVSVDTKMDYTTHVYASAPVTRNADNTINMNGLLVLTDTAKAIVGDKSGAVVGGTATPVLAVTGTVTTGLLYHKSKSDVGTFDGRNTMMYVLLLLAAAACVFAASKKRKNA